MSADHKRPLLAFALVLVVCVLIVVDGLRGQAAVVTALRSGAGRVVQGVQLVAIPGHEPNSGLPTEPPVLDAARTASHEVAPAGQPAPQLLLQPGQPTHASPATAAHGEQPHGPADPHPGAAAAVRHPGHPGHGQSQEHGAGARGPEGRSPAQHVVQHLSQQLGQILGQHDGPGRGPESRSDRGRGHGERWHGERGHEQRDRARDDRGRGHEDHGRGHGRGHGHDHGRGHAWGHHGWMRSR